MKEFLFNTDNSYAALLLRLTLGTVMLPHGAQKLLGWFGGYGFKNTMAYFTDTLHLPYAIGLLVILIEFFGSLCLIFGLTGKLIAILMILILLGAILTTNYQHGFFMNWFGNQQGEGFEYHLLFISMCLALVFMGSGKFSVDAWILNRG